MSERPAVMRFTLEPTPGQAALLLRHVGAARACQNATLAEYKNLLARREAGEEVRLPSSANDFINFTNAVVSGNPELSWHAEVSKYCRNSAAANLHLSFKNFRESQIGSRKGRAVSFPKFRKRGSNDAVSFGNGSGGEVRLTVDRVRRLVLPKIGSVKLKEVRLTRQLRKLLKRGARITSATVRRGLHWQVSLQLRVPAPERRRTPAPKPLVSAGVDLGMAKLMVVSSSVRADQGQPANPAGELLDANGDVVRVLTTTPNPRLLRRRERQLKRAQQALSRTTRGSKNRARAREQVARLHARVREARRTYHHQASARLVKTHDRIVLEDLSVVGMKKTLGKSVGDAGLASLKALIVHKGHRHQVELMEVSRWFPSSQTCSRCGVRREVNLLRGDRTFVCAPDPQAALPCGLGLDRDENAAEVLRKAPATTAIEPPAPLRPNTRKRLSMEGKEALHQVAVAGATAGGAPAPKPPRPRGNPWRTSDAVPAPTR